VIQISSTSLGQHTGRIELEIILISLNGYRYRLLENCSHKGYLGVSGNILESSCSHGHGKTLGYTGIGARGSVGICSRGSSTLVVNHILEGIVHETTIASLIALLGRAIHQLLLREIHESMMLHEPRTL
jgi:hypothetical protein